VASDQRRQAANTGRNKLIVGGWLGCITDVKQLRRWASSRRLCSCGRLCPDVYKLVLPNNFHLNPIEGVTWITDLCRMRIMSSTRIPYATALLPICWKLAPIFELSRCC
jgi:hypothetical protein